MRDRIFISYSHADGEWLSMLKDHLEPYVDAGTVTYWDDTQIRAGDNWLDVIEKALSVAKVAVLLVSPRFLKSEFIKNHELPPLIEAARRDGLTVVWIAVSHSSYKRTLLAPYQAANDPENPLAKLEPWERDKVLVEVCEKIEEAYGRPVTREWELPGPGRSLTDEEIIRCNRRRYLNRFTSLFYSGLTNRPGLPQVYLIYGKMGECHDNFVKRLLREVIKPYSDKEQAQPQRRGVYKRPDVGWPDPLGESESQAEEMLEGQAEELQLELSRVYSGDIQLGSTTAFPATTFADLPQFSSFRFVIVQHTIHLEEWTEKDWSGATKKLLNWYLNEYWAALVKQVPAVPASSHPQFIIFIKITYRRPKHRGWFLSFRKPQFDKELVKSDLRQIASRANKNFSCHLLDELLTPPYTEVYKWFKDNNIYVTEQDLLDAAMRIYKKYGEETTMARIEHELSQHPWT